MDIRGGCQPTTTVVSGHTTQALYEVLVEGHMVEDIQEILNRTCSLFY